MFKVVNNFPIGKFYFSEGEELDLETLVERQIDQPTLDRLLFRGDMVITGEFDSDEPEVEAAPEAEDAPETEAE